MCGNEQGTLAGELMHERRAAMLEGAQLERSLNSRDRDKTPQETAGWVQWAIGTGEAVYTVLRKCGLWSQMAGLNPYPPLPFMGLGQIPPPLWAPSCSLAQNILCPHV